MKYVFFKVFEGLSFGEQQKFDRKEWTQALMVTHHKFSEYLTPFFPNALF